MMSYSYDDLVNLGYCELQSRKGNEGIYLVNIDKLNERFYVDKYCSFEPVQKYINDVASEIEEYIPGSVYRRDSILSKESEKCFFEIVKFPIRKDKKKKVFASSLSSSESSKRNNRKMMTLKVNIPILRFFTMGDVDTPIHCSLSGVLLEGVSPSFNNLTESDIIHCWEQHHFKVKEKNSANKESANKDPSDFIKSVDLSIPSSQSLKAILDISNTMFISAFEHSKIHKSRIDSDIRDYESSKLPHALRCEENWERWKTFLQGFGYDTYFMPRYEEHYKNNCNSDS